jgi:hypothetical protein
MVRKIIKTFIFTKTAILSGLMLKNSTLFDWGQCYDYDFRRFSAKQLALFKTKVTILFAA